MVIEYMKRVLVTGGAGFIGSNFIRYMLGKRSDLSIINVDLLTYAGNLDNLSDLDLNPNYSFLRVDICDRESISNLFQEGIDYVVNFAAESHVDRSIEDSSAFVKTNIEGTQVLLECAKKYTVQRFLQVSTDEVYGSLSDTGYFTEATPLAPNSPYSASKAAADMFARAYYETHKLPVCITRCSNNYGPYQFPEKLIPLMISNALAGKELPVYGDGKNVRDWIHVLDHCSAIEKVLFEGKNGEVYNIGGNNEMQNIEIVKLILRFLDKPYSLIKYVKDRPGHDRRYAINSSKIQNELGWKPKVCFEDGIKATVDWYLSNRAWSEKILNGDYMHYYKRMYGDR